MTVPINVQSDLPYRDRQHEVLSLELYAKPFRAKKWPNLKLRRADRTGALTIVPCLRKEKGNIWPYYDSLEL